MEDQNETNDDEREIQTSSASLGDAKRADPNAPLADTPMSPQALDRRQAAFGERRRYAGPQSNEEPENSEESTPRSESYSRTDTPPTPCAEPPAEGINE